MVDLKPCPFCGSSDTDVLSKRETNWAYATCRACGAAGAPVVSQYGIFDSARRWEKVWEAAAAKWNRRDEFERMHAVMVDAIDKLGSTATEEPGILRRD